MAWSISQIAPITSIVIESPRLILSFFRRRKMVNDRITHLHTIVVFSRKVVPIFSAFGLEELTALF